jgi:hypothetical protein
MLKEEVDFIISSKFYPDIFWQMVAIFSNCLVAYTEPTTP